MRILQINTVYGEGSTGKIARSLHDLCVANGIACLTGYRYGSMELEDSVAFSTLWSRRIHSVLARYTMLNGFFSYFKTRAFLKQVDSYGPDLIQLHNLHGGYVNLPLLFRYIKKKQIPVVWTLHDCWPFTGICYHFTTAGCNRWQNGCHHCPQRKKCSSSPIDLSGFMWKTKKKWFTGLQDATIVTPSDWLAGLVRESFLKEYAVKVIHNGIDLQTFSPTPSDFREKYNLTNKKVVLGVAFVWGYEKGLDVFVELARRLPEDYAIVLVGTNDQVDAALPEGIISIHRTHDQKELAQIYSAADVFANPTREEVLGLVDLEALACGTPVITFRAGGSPECIDNTCGVAVDIDDIDSMEREILRICSKQPYSPEACMERARFFDEKQRAREYTDLYISVLSDPE